MVDQNRTIKSADNIPVGLAPCGIKKIVSGEEIPWNIIVCKSDMTIYFIQDNTKTWVVDAGTKIGVHPDMRLSDDAECLVF